MYALFHLGHASAGSQGLRTEESLSENTRGRVRFNGVFFFFFLGVSETKRKTKKGAPLKTRMCINAPRLATRRGNLAAAMRERLLSAGTAFDPPFCTFFHFFPPLPLEIYRRPHYLNYCLMINRAACAGYVHKGAAFLQKKQFSLVRTIKVSSDLFMQQCK